MNFPGSPGKTMVKKAEFSDSKRLQQPRHLSSSQLLAGDREVIIEHGSEKYRLQQTRSGKLILTK